MRRLLAVALVVLLPAVGCAAPAKAPQPGPSLLDRAAVIRAARRVTRARFPNADGVLVDNHVRTLYEADGTSRTVDDTYEKVLTEKGKREARTLSFHFTLPYSTIDVPLVEVIKPNGKAVPVDVAGQSRVMVDRSQMGSNIYNPNRKILRVGVPGVAIGDMVHYVSVRRTVKPRVPKTFSDYQVLEYTSPIVRYVFEVAGPKALPLRRIAMRDEIKGAVAFKQWEADGQNHYLWTVRNVPRMYREPSMPALHTVVQRLLVSTIPDWKDISKWYWNLCAPHFETTPAMRRTVKELVRDAKTPQAKTEAVFRYVSQKIRYMGITTEKTAPGYEPHDVQITFEQKYGVCRDKAALLVAMLREAGLPAYPVLIHNGPKKDVDIPQPYFNHAIVAVGNPDGTYRLMDPTDENTKELFPAYLCNQSYLVARAEGETLLTSPIIPAEENLMRIETRGRLDAAGNLTAESVLRFAGINDNAYRGYFSRIKPEERRRFFEMRAKQVAPGAALTAFSITPEDMLDTSQPLMVKMRFAARDVLVTNGKTAMLPVPQWGTRVGIVNFILGRTGLKKRKYPLKTDIACGVQETISVDVADALAAPLALPGYAPIESPEVTWRQALAREGGALTGKSDFRIKVVEFSPKSYLALKAAMKEIEYNQRKMPVFAAKPVGAAAPAAKAPSPAPAAADAEVLAEDVAYDIENAHAWTETRTVRKKVLTYAGKKASAELKLSYNPTWETVTVEEAKVTAADGSVKTIRPEEMNLMDAGWAGAAPRYPAGKTLVVSLPGVDVGSTIAYRVKRVKKERPFFAMREYLRGFDPVRHKRVTVTLPAGERWARPGGAVKGKGPRAWVEGRVRGWEVKNQPAVLRERHLPPRWGYLPKAFVSRGGWEAYAAVAREALTAAATRQPKTMAKALALVEGRRDAAAKVRAIRDFVARSIRRAGPGFQELPLRCLTPADRTLAEGYGHGADRAVVLYAMLKTVGLRPSFVLASGERDAGGLDNPLRAHPDPRAFGRVLVRVPLATTAVYLNDTDQYAALGATPHDNCLGLDLVQGEVVTLRAPAPLRDRDDTFYAIALDADGTARITKRRLFRGAGFGAFHRQFAEMPPEERRRHYMEIVARISSAAEATGPLETQYDVYPGVESFAVTVPRLAVRDGRYLYLKLPEVLPKLDACRADTRANPLYFARPVRRVLQAEIRLPKGAARVVLAPPPYDTPLRDHVQEMSLLDGAVKVATRVRGERGKIFFRQELTIEPIAVPAEHYGGLLDLNRALGHPRTRTILVEMKEKD
jgi:transglutaminase-like putative cysteine protease